MNRTLPLIRRVQQRRARALARPQLNLVALMDVFTLLVFFFLAHSSDVGEPANTRFISLPESVANRVPRETLVISITQTGLMVRDEAVASIESVLNSPRSDIGPLREALERARQADRAGSPNAAEPAVEVTIMGDKSIPFRLLRKVMITCTQAGYSRISLAVLQRSTQSG
jgi:biopolymer transport protein ExbD